MPEQPKPETELHDEIDRLQNVLRRQDRFVGMLLHELRNPVAAISMAAEALSQFAAKSPEMTAMTDVISRQSLQAGQLLDELLEMSRIVNGKLQLRKERIDLVTRLSDVVNKFRPQFDDLGLQVRWEPSPALAWIEADVGKISQALRSLIEALMRLSRRGDEVTMRVASSGIDELATVEISGANENIAVDALAAIFEPFGQHEAIRHAALGLRLPIAKGLIELHGGSVQAESALPGKGIRFRIALPITDSGEAQTTAAVSDAPGQRSLRILVIDDNPDVGTSLEFLLKASGHTLAVAISGRQGVELARQQRPDVVLCDIGLPDIDGYAVARQLRSMSETASTYLIAVSGFVSEEDQRRSLAAGFDMHLNKPEGFVGLNARLQELPIRRAE